MSIALRSVVSGSLPKLLESQLSELTSLSSNGLKMLRIEASYQTGNELDKELEVHCLLFPHVEEIKPMVNALQLSPLNQQHYAERVTYYGAKLKRRSPKDHRLSLL